MNTPVKPDDIGIFMEQPILDDAVIEPTIPTSPVTDTVVAKVDIPPPAEPPIVKDAIVRPAQQVTQELPVSFIDDTPDSSSYLTLPSNHDKEVRKVIAGMPNINVLDSAKAAKWGEVVAEGMDKYTFQETFIPTLEDTGADFRQTVKNGETHLVGGQPRLSSVTNETLSGERGIIRMMSWLGLGTLFQIPLWNTGIWVTFKAPSESALVELNRIISNDKITFGRYTYGLVFSNITAYTLDRLTTFALEHMYETTIKPEGETSVDYMRKLISAQDIHVLIWGLVCTMYPSGYKYRRACIEDPEKCNHVVEELLNVSKLIWTNNTGLTDWQKSHMANRRGGSMTPDSVKRYKEEMLKSQPRTVNITSNTGKPMRMVLKTPSIAEYIDSGYKWISSMVSLVERSLGKDVAIEDRNNFINTHGQATAMRQYVHWVNSIEFDSNNIEEASTIEELFNVLSADDAIREEFIIQVVKYINESTISVIGIPAYNCPVCNTEQDIDKLPKHVNIIPLDVPTLFFAQLGHRIQKIGVR